MGTRVRNTAFGGAAELSVILNRDAEQCWGMGRDTVTHWAFAGFWDAQELNSVHVSMKEVKKNSVLGHAFCSEPFLVVTFCAAIGFENYGKCLLFPSRR